MRVTASHRDLWLYRAGPKWARESMERKPNIDGMISAKGRRRPPSYEMDASNLLAILSLARKRGALIKSMEEMAAHAGTMIRPARRSAYCKKWLAKIKIRREQAMNERASF